MKQEIHTSEGGSKYIGTLPLGCQMCMRGQKMVLFVGGKCQNPSRCSWYCPISVERKNSDDVYADEIKIDHPDAALLEAELIRAHGAGITGGDPLGTVDQTEVTLFYIEELKTRISENFHIHLYTTGKNFTPELAKELADVGLDEIRFHPADEDFHRIEYALDLGMAVGAEVPVIPTPDYEEYLKNLIDYLDNIGADFVNLNEFEINEPNAKSLKSRGFTLREDSIASVNGSAELAEKILNEMPERYTVSVHYCPISLKDGVQLRNRYIRRAESIRKPFEEVTDDGTLIFIRVKGKLKNIKLFYQELLEEKKIPFQMMEIIPEKSNGFLDLPVFLSKEKSFISSLYKHHLKGGIMETLPFRGEYSEMCEYTPLENDN